MIGFKTSIETPRKRYSSDPKTRARELVADGKIGGPRPGSGPRRKTHTDAQSPRATQVIAEALRENADLAASVVPDVLRDPDATRAQKIAAVKLGLKIEGDQAEYERQEAKEGRRLPEDIDPDASRGDLVRSLVAKLAENPIVAHQLAAVLSRVEAPEQKPAKPF